MAKNARMAEYWLRRAANNGSVSAMIDLSQFLIDRYRGGQAVVEAYRWTAVALMRAKENEKPGAVIWGERVQKEIIEKGHSVGLNMGKLKQDGESQARKVINEIPVEIDPIKDQNIVLQNIRKKYGE